MGQAIDGFYAHLGGRVREWRMRRGLSQAELGAQLEPPVTRACVANLEKGQQRVLAHTLAQLSTILTAPLSDLLPGAPDPEQAWESLVPEVAGALRLSDARARALVDRLREPA
ncbi:MAG: helix-turn-helix domain-containing protein [Vicinamibacterales bacterium]